MVNSSITATMNWDTILNLFFIRVLRSEGNATFWGLKPPAPKACSSFGLGFVCLRKLTFQAVSYAYVVNLFT